MIYTNRTSSPTPLRWRGEKKEVEYSPLHRRGVGGEVLFRINLSRTNNY
jgi:hypothetical protein